MTKLALSSKLRTNHLRAAPEQSGSQSQKVRASRKDRAFRAVQGNWYLSQSLRSFAPCKRSKPFCFSSRCALFVSDCWLGDAPRLSPNWQSVLSFRINLRGSPTKPEIAPSSKLRTSCPLGANPHKKGSPRAGSRLAAVGRARPAVG